MFYVIVFYTNPKPSFTDENILSSLKKLLKEEFDIQALVKRNQQTLGICFTVPKLLSSNRKTMPIVIDQLQDIMLVVRRVLLSTNADIKFFQINIRGKDTGLEISLIRYLKDLKILLLSGISFGDYSKRMLYRNVTNIESLGKKRINRFLNDLGKTKPEKIIASHFSANIKRNNIDSHFVTWLWEALMKLNIEHEILDIRMMPHSEDSYYFYCKVRETFQTKQGFKNFSFSTYSGEVKEFLFDILAINYYNVMINRLHLLNQKDKQDTELANIIKTYGDPNKWHKSDFFVFSLTLENFLAEQIAGRIHGKISETIKEDDKETSILPRLTAVKGIFDEGVFKILFIYRDKKENVETQDADLALTTVKNVCNLYKFKDCKEVKIGTLNGPLTSYQF